MKKTKKARKSSSAETSLKEALLLYSQVAELKKQVKEASESRGRDEGRLTDLEVHVSLLTRLLTTLCVERFGMRIGTLKRLVRRIEKEAVRDSQILELEILYNLSKEPLKKKNPLSGDIKRDPWDQIS
ncbi:MAG TPA: hypothetical protein PK997_02570 [Candidatus Omnitrophota bacterium]|jgi:hypothetical protein|nr:MAG: hypothetical protein BWY49_01198 [Candidatus Omnitrophica bacterium ADurb.Bin314]HOE68215.1 hypothetical protein [Candidatus Omnitrophota bacterium]HQB94073.1 hypothetical protein [Candidatus Omnitrophota bacterium]